MSKTGIDQQALIDMFANASAQQTAQLRQAVYTATLSALQGRELSLKNIRKALGAVSEAATAGAAKNPLMASAGSADVTALLDTAVAGMDDALLKAVEANRVALAQFVDRGIDLRETQLKKALGDLEKMEDALIGSVKKAAEMAGGKLAEGAASAAAAAGGAGGLGGMAGPWQQVLEKLGTEGSRAGAQATQAMGQLEQQMAQAQAAMRAGRAASLKAAQTMMDSYTALASGVLIGLSDAFKQQGSAAAKSGAAKRK